MSPIFCKERFFKLVQDSKNNPLRLQQFRNEIETLASSCFKNNCIHQHHLMSDIIRNNFMVALMILAEKILLEKGGGETVKKK